MRDPLSRLLDLYPAQFRPIAPPSLLANAGGSSGATLWRFDSGLGPLVARAWPIDGPGPAELMRIHDWLARLAGLDFIPVPLATRDGRTLAVLDGRSWEIAPWRPGLADPARPPAPARLRAAFSGLAAVHQRLAFAPAVAPSPGLAARIDEAERLLASELSELEAIVGRDRGEPLQKPALRWIALARGGLPDVLARLRREATAAVPLFPVLRDTRPDHFLFDGDRLTGLVDFGAMGVDSPATDLARLLNEWVGPDRAARAEALDAYDSIRLLAPVEVSLIEVFAESSAWLGPARWVRWHFAEHRRFDDPDAVRLGLDRSLGRLLERLASGLS